jgi:hypothetical protein
MFFLAVELQRLGPEAVGRKVVGISIQNKTPIFCRSDDCGLGTHLIFSAHGESERKEFVGEGRLSLGSAKREI